MNNPMITACQKAFEEASESLKNLDWLSFMEGYLAGSKYIVDAIDRGSAGAAQAPTLERNEDLIHDANEDEYNDRDLAAYQRLPKRDGE